MTESFEEQEPGGARPAPPLGRLVMAVIVGLMLMVALGVFWVWQRAHREEQWRRQVNSTEEIRFPRPEPAPR